MRQLGAVIADTLDPDIGRLERARRTKRKEEVENEYYKHTAPKLIHGMQGRIVEMWKSFERLLFNMSKADKGNHIMKDFWGMSIYELLTYKQLLTEHLQARNGMVDDKDE